MEIRIRLRAVAPPSVPPPHAHTGSNETAQVRQRKMPGITSVLRMAKAADRLLALPGREHTRIANLCAGVYRFDVIGRWRDPLVPLGRDAALTEVA